MTRHEAANTVFAWKNSIWIQYKKKQAGTILSQAHLKLDKDFASVIIQLINKKYCWLDCLPTTTTCHGAKNVKYLPPLPKPLSQKCKISSTNKTTKTNLTFICYKLSKQYSGGALVYLKSNIRQYSTLHGLKYKVQFFLVLKRFKSV